MPKPADPLSDTLYDMVSLNRLFFVSSILLIAATVWAAWQDYDRNWKHYQRDYNRIALERAEKERAAANSAINRLKKENAQVAELYTNLEAAKAAVAGRQADIDKLNAEREDHRGALEKALQKFQFDKSEADTAKQRAESAGAHLAEAKEKLEKLRKANSSDAASVESSLKGLEAHAADALQNYQEWSGKVNESKLAFEELNAKEVVALEAIEKIVKTREDAQKEVDRVEAELILVNRKIAKLEPSLSKTLLAMPGLDFIANPEHIEQDILPHFQEDLNFSTVGKIDRCRTCHMAIDKRGWTEKELPAVFRSHPNIDLYVGDNSPHPVSKFGCTICHEGSGRSVDFYTTAHMPKDAKQGEEWKEKYGWSPIHHFDKPMLPTPYIESSCTKCHASQVRVTMGEKVNLGRQVMEKVGCFGCHPIAGMENLRKVGPALNGIRHKVTRDWAYNWIRKPTDFRPTTHMPQAFDLSNTSDAEAQKKNTAMIQGIVEYLFENSELAHVKDAYPAPPAGDAAAGKKLFDFVGCVACHVAGDMNKAGTQYTDFGPNLSTVGSKLNAGWIFAWLKNPAQYFHYTSMPSLRLADQEAADITAFLLTQKHPGDFPNRKLPPVVEADVEATLLAFLQSSTPTKLAQEKVRAMSPEERLLDLGKRAIGHQGCFGCHDIKGFEKTKKIGAELTGSNATGSKDITKFDFGFRHDLLMGHTAGAYDRVAWVKAKLENPRTFDGGRFVEYAERLRMPKFRLTEEERDALATWVLSFRTRENIPVSHMRNLSHEEAVVNAGKTIVMQSNCASCHKVGLFPTRIAVSEEALPEIATARVYVARTILSDGRQVERVSADELAILRKKGVDILLPAGTWLFPQQITALLENQPPVTSVLVYAWGEAQIKEQVGDTKAPPFIVGEGAKVNPDWFFRFLKNPTEIRPWLADKADPGARMPTFGFTDDEASLLVEHFAVLAGEKFPFQYDPPLDEKVRGELVVRGKGVFERMECGKCHVVEGAKLTTDTPAPAFALVAPRIQKDWFAVWLRDPQSIAPGTGMTAFNEEQVKPDEVDALREFIWSLHKK
ncbi:MAG: c-type cytochrome [Planctomycetes bacterium]|nr:c-type cytochrome [Planctomycetota bacterium]